MLPILEIPPIVSESSDEFASVLSYHQHKHFERYVTCLMTDDNVTVAHMTDRFGGAVNQSSLNRFLTEYQWSIDELNRSRLRLLQQTPQMQWRERGIIIIDDTLIEKSGKLIPGAGKFFDHSEGHYMHAQNIVTSNYADWRVTYPIGFRQYFKEDSLESMEYGFKTKIQLAMELVSEAIDLGVAARTFVADSWFCSQKLIDHIEQNGRDWVMECPCDYLVLFNRKWTQLKDYAKTVPEEQYQKATAGGKIYWVHTRTMVIKFLGRKVKVAISYDNPELKGDPKFLITNKIKWERNRILRTYGLRWDVEPFYRDSKQHVGLEGCQLRNLQGTHRHWMLVFTAYSILRQRVVLSCLCKKLSGRLETIGDGCRYANRQLLETLVMRVYQLALEQQTPQQILEVILS